jgi:hypothetical protein
MRKELEQRLVERWTTWFTFLSPFSAVLWFITISNLVFHRRDGYLMQAVVFFGTASVIYLLLMNGAYHP